jgi:hypothetical protein
MFSGSLWINIISINNLEKYNKNSISVSISNIILVFVVLYFVGGWNVEEENGLQVKQGSNAMLEARQFGLGASLV